MQSGILLLKEFCTFHGITLCFPRVLVGGLVIFKETKIICLLLWKEAKDLRREFHYYKVRQRWVRWYRLTFFSHGADGRKEMEQDGRSLRVDF